MSAKVAKIFLLTKKTLFKYRKNNKYDKIHDFGKEEALRDHEMAEISQKSQK